MTPVSNLFATLAFLSSFLLVLAAITHVKRRNLPLSSLAIGLLLLNVFNVVNVLVWSPPNSNQWWDGHGLCDVEVKLYLGVGQSVIGTTASIFRRLANILDTNKLTLEIPSGRKWNQWVFEACMVYLLPAMVMCLHYVVQPNRYALSRFTGCRVTWDPSWPAVVLLWLWYPLACAVCLYYTFLTVLRLLQHRRQVNTILRNSNSNTNKSRFLRLLGLASVFVIFFTPAAAYFFIFNVKRGMGSGYSWDTVHPPNWSMEIGTDVSHESIALDRWAQAFAGILVFLFFGIGKEAVTMYSQVLPGKLQVRCHETLHLVKNLAKKAHRVLVGWLSSS